MATTSSTSVSTTRTVPHLVGGVVLALTGFAVGVRFLVAVGAMGVLLGAALFVLASLSVVLESRQNDLR
jgi:hypothetical protein